MSSSKTIGIIGGGQLGQMMAISAIYMGHKVIALDPAADCPASRVAEIIVAPYNDVDALRQLAERCDVLTYEFENVDADGLDAVIKEGQLPQGTDLLRISQNRIFEKDFLSNKAQVTVAPYKVVTSRQELADIDLSKNYVLKTATGGYDGHGQKVIRSEEDLEDHPELAEMMAEFDTYIGELFISVDKAREQAAEYGHSFEREMGFLAVHGFLHINGYDHYTPEEEKEMFGLQEEILTAYGLTRQ